MAGVASIGAINAALESERIAQEYAARVLRAQLDAVEQLGEETVRLVEISGIEPGVGQFLDISI